MQTAKLSANRYLPSSEKGTSWLRRAFTWGLASALLLALSSHTRTTATTSPSTFANFEASQTNPIRLSPDGTRLFAVNTPNGTVTVFDVTKPGTPVLKAEIPVGIEPVSVNPLNDDVAWVVNQVSNSISIVSVSKGIVTNTLNLISISKPGAAFAEPEDVVFANNNKQAYVSIGRGNSVAVFNVTTGALITNIPLYGDNPRALTVSPDGTKVYVAFALSGNGTTLIPSRLAPPQSAPVNPALPPPPQVGLITSATNPNYPTYLTYTMPDNDVAIINVAATPTLAGYYSGVGTINLGMAANPTNGDLYVANTDALNTIHFETNLNGHFVNNRITHINVGTGQITPVDLNPNIDYSVLPSSASLASALAQPTNVVFDPSGSFMYVAAFGTDRVAKVDTSGNVLSFVEVSQASGSGSSVDPANKRGPRGLALNAGAHTLYSLNRIYDSISVINTASNAVTNEVLLNDPTPTTIKQGRGFLYDAKLSGSGTASCAACHVDGDMDHLAWDLGDPAGTMNSVIQNGKVILYHPMKGPMTTQTLRGLINLTPYHWRGDKPEFSAFNGAFPALMGGPSISTSDMNNYTTFANSILFMPNPNQKLDRSLPTSLVGVTGNPVTGETIFTTVPKTKPAQTCNSCHSYPGPGSNRVIDTNETQPLKMPQLRNIYQKLLYTRFAKTSIDGFGLNNDGDGAGFQGFFQDPNFSAYSKTQQNDMAAFEMCFDTGTAPGVGYTRTLTASSVAKAGIISDWATLEAQAATSPVNIQLIARGTISGQIHGLLYQGNGNYLTDTGVTYTHAQLLAFVTAGDTLTIMGVVPGTGTATY